MSEMSAAQIAKLTALPAAANVVRIATGADNACWQTFKTSGISLLTAVQTVVVPAQVGKLFIPRDISIRLTTVTGAIIIAAIVRLGNNGSFSNVAPLRTLISSAAQNVEIVPLLTQINAIDVDATGISLDVQTIATGATVLIAECVISGLVV